jgi:S1-C subfamily serine protease
VFDATLNSKRRFFFMKTRNLLIALGVVVVVGVLCMGAAAGGALAYFASQPRAARALGPVRVLQPRQASAEAGVLVAEVAEGGPAAGAGVARGDIILEVNGEPVNRPVELAQALSDLKPGEEVELKVKHGDDQRTLTVTLGDRDGRAYLGLTPLGFPMLGEVFIQGDALQGARITAVTPGSPAEQAGLKKGDAILAVDDVEVGSENSLEDLIGAHKPGDSVALKISRPGEEQRDVKVKLGENPDQPGKAYLGVNFVTPLPPRLQDGMPFKDMPFEGKPLEIPELPEGVSQAVLIGKLVPGGPADKAGLLGKDFITEIDGTPVESPEGLSTAVQSHKPGDQITLTVFHPGETELKKVEVTLGKDPQEGGKAYMGISALGFIRIQRDNNGAPNPDLDFQLKVPVPDFLDKIRDRYIQGQTL